MTSLAVVSGPTLANTEKLMEGGHLSGSGGKGLDEDTLLVDLLIDDGDVLPLDILEYVESALDLDLDDVNLLSRDCSDWADITLFCLEGRWTVSVLV